MNISFVYLRPTRLAFVRATGRHSVAAQEAWARIFKWLDQLPAGRSVNVGYGLNRGNPRLVGREGGIYDACVEIAPEIEDHLPSDFRSQTLPGGPYARYRHIGPHSGLAAALVKMRDEGLTRRNLVICPERPVVEIFLSDPRKVVEELLRTDICLPVRASSSSAAA